MTISRSHEDASSGGVRAPSTGSLDRLFGQAVALHQAGNRAAADQVYRQVLTLAPNHADSLHLLGRLAHEAGQSARGLELIERALALQPRAAAYHDSCGQVLKALGRLDEAIEAYRKAVRLDARSFGYRYNLGNALYAADRFEEAALSFRRALLLNPDFADAHNNLGNAYRGQGNKRKEAAAAFRAALQRDPTRPEFHFNLGSVLVADGEVAEAEPCFVEVVRLQPDHATAWLQLASLRRKRDDLVGAVPCYEAAMRLLPDDATIPTSLSEVLAQLNRLEESERMLRIVLRLAPDSYAWNNLSSVLHSLGRLDEAAASLAEALRLDPTNIHAQYGRAVYCLATGRFAEGWEKWETRFQAFGGQPPPYPGPCWAGEAAEGRVLFVYREQGLGDYIQFCRFVSLAAQRARVLLHVPKMLDRLLRSLPGAWDKVVSDNWPEPPPAFDLHVPMLSLPRALGITLENLPAAPYLQADAEVVAAWRARLAALPGMRVGLAWAGNPDYHTDRHRSLAGGLLAALAGITGVSFVSLQLGGAPWTKLPDEVRVALDLADPTAALADFADTAALIAALDVVISVDTSIVHLAGALGHPVWLLNRFDTDWRWLPGRSDSPWYPSLRIFTQQRPGDWGGVLTEVRTALIAQAALTPSSS